MFNKRNKNSENQIAFMQRLINFGNSSVNENKINSTPIVEVKKQAADGKTYGIVREASKYYIMEAPVKDTEVLAEDFDYIGGFNNRKENAFSSFAKASNALDLKIMAINENVEKSKKVVVEKPIVKAEWEDSITEGMRKEIDRFKTITTNAARILKEEKGDIIPSTHTLPEAPAKNPSDEKVNAPYTDTAVADGDKDFKKEQTNHEKAGNPFVKDASVSDKDMEDTKNKKGGNGSVYTEKPQYVDTGVAGEHPSGGEVVHVNENKKTRVKLTLEQVLAWNDNKDYMDKSTETHIGSSAPYDEKPEQIVQEDVAVHNTDDQNNPTPGTGEAEQEKPYEVEVNEDYSFGDAEFDDGGFDDYPFPDEVDFETEGLPNLDDYNIPEIPTDKRALDTFKHDYDEFAAEQEKDIEPDENDEELEDEPDFELEYDDEEPEDIPESRHIRGRRVNETTLNDFGKTPGYRKVPMTTLPNVEVAKNARTWDDESAQGDEPFGKSKGDGAPFSILVDAITKEVYKAFYGDKKKS